MKKIYFLSLLALTIMFSANRALAQTTYTKQVIIVNGNIYSDPDDFVTVASYNPETQETTEFATIHTQSVQDVIVHEGFAYVAAQDSIVKLDIDNYSKVAAVTAPGINKLATDGNVLLASYWYPNTENFIKIYSLENLEHITTIEGISGEAAGIFVKDGIALVAVPGPYGTTTGKIASLDINEGTLLSEDDYGESFVDISFFASWNNVTTAFMKTEYGGSTAVIATLDAEGEIIKETNFDISLAGKTGQMENVVYAEINNGIGSINIETSEIINETIVAPQTMSIAASAIDTVNNLIYLTTSDFYSAGDGFIYNLSGENTGLFEAGVSAQAIAIDYRLNTGINKIEFAQDLTVFPNPATNHINFNIPSNQNVVNTIISDVAGKIVYNKPSASQIDVNSFNSGLYFITIKTNSSVFNGRFIKE
jgi:hypothetical protein